MSNRVEYLFAASIIIADQAARQQGWRQCSRDAWLKRERTTVYFLSLLVQLEIVSASEIVHVLGNAPEALRP